jgi:hypothetical protein
MLDIQDLKKKYEEKLWKKTTTGELIWVRQIVFYDGTKKYRLIMDSGLPSKPIYMNDITEEQLLEELSTFSDPYANAGNLAADDTTKTGEEIITELTTTLVKTIKNLETNSIKVEKAVAISKIAQVVLNAEKTKATLYPRSKQN